MNCSYDRLYCSSIFYSFPLWCRYKYWQSVKKVVISTFFQWYKGIFIVTTNNNPNAKAWGNSTRPEVFLISSKVPDLGSQPKVKIASNRVDWYKTSAIFCAPQIVTSLPKWNCICTCSSQIVHQNFYQTGSYRPASADSHMLVCSLRIFITLNIYYVLLATH